MTIVRARWARFRLPYAGPFATARGAEAMREGLILRLETDDGCTGLGEASPVPGFGGDTLADAEQALAEWLPAVVGREVEEVHQLPASTAAACALDTALLDLQGQRAGVPVAGLLGGSSRRVVPVNATIVAPAPDAAAAAARAAVEAGFGCVKLKVGLAPTPGEELVRIAAVRAAIGPAVELRLDANGAWDAAGAVALLRAAESLDLALVEQPVPAGDLAGMAAVRRRVGVPIAADESAGTPERARRVIAAEAADALVVKPMLTGGLRAARAVVDLARDAGLRAIVTTTIDAGVGVVAALHLAAILSPPVPACGLATGPLLAADLLSEPLRAAGGMMRPPDGPGLGVALDEAQLGRFAGPWRGVSA